MRRAFEQTLDHAPFAGPELRLAEALEELGLQSGVEPRRTADDQADRPEIGGAGGVFAMTRVTRANEIYPVFRELFKKEAA